MAMMWAIEIDEEREGKPLEWREVERPEPGPGEVLIQVAATAVNRADLVQRRGAYAPPPGASHILGLECSGIVAALGEGVEGWSVGDEVCALLTGGGYADYAVAPAECVMPVPKGLSLSQAAALPEVVCTAWLNLFIEAGLVPGEVAMVHAAASGVGTAALQMCKALGIEVVATASGSKQGPVEHHGATVFVDRKSEDFVERVREEYGGVDVILCPVGADYLERNLSVLNRKGRLVLIGLMGGRSAEINLGRLLVKRQRLIGSVLRARPVEEKAPLIREIVEKVWPMVEEGSLRPVIHDFVHISEAEAAHALVASNETIGKVVLVVDAHYAS